MFAINFVLAELNIGLFIMEMMLFLTSVFLMLLILVQRGKGGGLTGALGGSGGGSAFGAKAGDAFTKITIYVAAFWIFLCIMTIAFFNPPPSPQGAKNTPAATVSSDEDTADAGEESGDAGESEDAGSSSDSADDDSAGNSGDDSGSGDQ